MKKSIFTIRKKKHAKHPQVIVYADRIIFKSLTLTHSRGRRRKRNIPLKFNPNPQDKKSAFVSKTTIKDFKFNYSKAFKNYRLSDDDIIALIAFIEPKKK